MKSAALLATAALFGADKAHAASADFGEKELLEFREEIRELILSGAGLNAESELTGPFDVFFGNELPLIPAAVRLGYHDCAGEFPSVCNGCLDLDSKANGGLEESVVDIIEPVCSTYLNDYELSRADCWALTATFALEISTQLTEDSWDYLVNDFFNVDLDKKDFPSGPVEPGDIPYYIGRVDCDDSPSLTEGFQEELPGPRDSWQITRSFFGDRFGFSDKETIALIVGGHSLGYVHSLIAPIGAGTWDVSPGTCDNEYAKSLLGENRILDPFNWQNGRYISDGPGPRTFFVENDDFLTYSYCDDETTDDSDSSSSRRLLGSSSSSGSSSSGSSSSEESCANEVFPFTVNKGFIMLDVDINLAYDTTFYQFPSSIECRPTATRYCEDNEPGTRVLYPGESIDDYPGETACTQVQCPLLCENGADGLAVYESNGFEDVSSECPVAYIRQFADDEDEWIDTFTPTYTKLITSGYNTEDANDCFDSSSSSSDSSSSSSDSSSSRRRLSEDEYVLCYADIDYDSLDSSDRRRLAARRRV